MTWPKRPLFSGMAAGVSICFGEVWRPWTVLCITRQLWSRWWKAQRLLPWPKHHRFLSIYILPKHRWQLMRSLLLIPNDPFLWTEKNLRLWTGWLVSESLLFFPALNSISLFLSSTFWLALSIRYYLVDPKFHENQFRVKFIFLSTS